jgi:hypothetical protein
MLDELRVHKIQGKYVLSEEVSTNGNGNFRWWLGKPSNVLNSIDEVVKAVNHLSKWKHMGKEYTKIYYFPGLYPEEANKLIRACEGYTVLLRYG